MTATQLATAGQKSFTGKEMTPFYSAGFQERWYMVYLVGLIGAG